VEVCRRLVDAGAFVSPVLTAGATRFVGTLTFTALASEPARTSLWDSPEPIPHTRLGQAADLVVVAPATARLIAAYAAGLSSDLLTATLLATRAPVVVCPAMHTEMWEHPAVVENIATLRRRGVHVVDPEAGRLAGGDTGSGRLAEPARIVSAAAEVLGSRPGPGQPTSGPLAGLDVVVTAGGTREPIDPVRFIGNRSSGKQGYAIASELSDRGARVTLVSTATGTLADPAGVTVVAVETALQMERAVMDASRAAAVVVMAAAVADFRPKAAADIKLKKSDGPPEVVLEPTTDILAALGANRTDDKLLVGFAAETAHGPGREDAAEHLRRYAREKLSAKGADIVVANDVAAPGVGFAHDTNAVLIVGSDGVEIEIPLASKEVVAAAIADAIETRLASKAGPATAHGRARDDAEIQERP
jgi:phosphopantothenoylcysteine decarboxylase/phosphopantothenate--cysteine ligase